MTDNEIIKALECCTQNTKCPTCPMWNTGQNCMNRLYQYALDLINRLQARVEKCEKVEHFADKTIATLQAENERLQELVNDMGDYFPACINCEGKTEFGERTDKCVYLIDNTNYCIKRGITNIVAIQNENRQLKQKLETAKSEARKEFAERLCEDRVSNDPVVIAVKCLLKEMESENNVD